MAISMVEHQVTTGIAMMLGLTDYAAMEALVDKLSADLKVEKFRKVAAARKVEVGPHLKKAIMLYRAEYIPARNKLVHGFLIPKPDYDGFYPSTVWKMPMAAFSIEPAGRPAPSLVTWQDLTEWGTWLGHFAELLADAIADYVEGSPFELATAPDAHRDLRALNADEAINYFGDHIGKFGEEE